MIEKYVDAEELKRLISTLVVILAVLAIGGLFAIIVVPGLRNANRPETPTPVSPAVGEPGWLDPTEFPPERGRVVPPVDPKTLIAPSPDLIAKGKELFAANCVQCHGERGGGDGSAVGELRIVPADFRGARPSLAESLRALRNCVEGTPMAPWTGRLSEAELSAVAYYVRGFFQGGQ